MDGRKKRTLSDFTFLWFVNLRAEKPQSSIKSPSPVRGYFSAVHFSAFRFFPAGDVMPGMRWSVRHTAIVFWTCLLVPALSVWWFGIRPLQVHREWADQVDYRILRLAEHRPKDVPPRIWSNCLLWTWHLHSNFGHFTSYFEPQARDPFLADFDAKLSGEVNLSTIDWIWDQYALHAPRSRGCRHWRPTLPERLAEFTSEPGGYDMSYWLKELKDANQRRRK